jgi:hypothetical protein
VNAHPPVGRLETLPYTPALHALAAHLGDCAPCSDPQRSDCPAGQTLTDRLRAARAAQTEAARWN